MAGGSWTEVSWAIRTSINGELWHKVAGAEFDIAKSTTKTCLPSV